MPKIHYCEAEGCEAEATETVPVSLDKAGDSKRHYCWTCSQVYHTGVQHGSLRENPNAYREVVKVPEPFKALQALVRHVELLPRPHRRGLDKELITAKAVLAHHARQ